MLTDWFDQVGYDKWIEKWKPDTTINIDKKMKQHTNWIMQSDIGLTPTFFINGKKLPGRYSLNDLEPLILQLTGLLKEEITN